MFEIKGDTVYYTCIEKLNTYTKQIEEIPPSLEDSSKILSYILEGYQLLILNHPSDRKIRKG